MNVCDNINNTEMSAHKWGALRTNDTNLRKGNFIHNCPYCRCQKDPPVSLYLQGLNQTDHNPLPNSYEYISLPPFTMTFPPRQSNVVFSYMSPPKFRRYHSQAKFNTKRYKNQHFPFIGKINEQEPHLISILTQPIKQNIQTLKTSSFKPINAKRNYAQINQNDLIKKDSSNSNTSNNHNGNAQSQNGPSDYSRDLKATPIQYLKLFPPLKQPQRPKDQQSLQSEEAIIVKAKETAKIYPTINSIDIFQPQQRQVGYLSSSPEYTSLKFMKVGERAEVHAYDVGNENEALASSLAQQLQLNFDYYFPPSQTDKSLSIGVEL